MNDDEKRLCGLNYARSLNFTDAQYEEALKRISSLDNANQLLVALIDVSSRDTNQTAKETSQIGTDHLPEITNHQLADDDLKTATLNSDYQQQTLNPVESNSVDGSASSLSTSCYSSITSLPSSSDQSLDGITRHQGCNQYASQESSPTLLRKIFIDGSNVAKTHGKDRVFSWTGIKLCVDWFMNRDHRVVKVLIPIDKCYPQHPIDEAILNHLIEIDALIKTPSGCNDDLFIIEAAKQSNGIIVSNDRFRDEKRFNDELDKYIFLNRLPYIFVDDLFIPANDPRGRNGPTLSEFLRESEDASQNNPNNNVNQHSKLTRTKSHQRYQRNAVYYKRPNQTNSLYHRSLQTKSLPLDQTRSSTLFADHTHQQVALGDRQTMVMQTNTIIHGRSQQMNNSMYNNHQDDRNMDRQARKSMSVTYGHNQSSRAQLLSADPRDFRQSFSGGSGSGGDGGSNPLRRSIM